MKIIMTALLWALALTNFAGAQSRLGSLPASQSTLQVLMVVNEGFRPEEYFIPRAIFNSVGLKTTVATRYEGYVKPSRSHQATNPPVKSDITFEKVNTKNYDAIVFVGGNGAWNDFLPNPEVHRILLTAMQQQKTVALICAATGLLATAGNLDGNHPYFKGAYVTGYPDVEGLLKRVGLVRYLPGTPGKPHVVVHKNLITARDPISAQMFGETIVQRLVKR